MFKLRKREIERKKRKTRTVVVLCIRGVIEAAEGDYLWLRDRRTIDDAADGPNRRIVINVLK